MKETFLKKKGIVTNYLAADLLHFKKGDRLPIISEYQTKFQVSRGTIQNALHFLKEKQAIVCESRGHLGTFLLDIDYAQLQTYALSESILGTMPLPYSKRYEGFATGLYAAFEAQQMKLNMAYLRGAKARIHSVVTKTYRFAVISRFAANEAMQQSEPIDILLDFGDHTYLSEHVLLFADAAKQQLTQHMKIGIDNTSYDQQLLTKALVKDLDVTLVELPGHQLIHALNQKIIDAGVWNYDEIVDKHYQNLHHVFLMPNQHQLDMSAAVIIGHEEDQATRVLFKQLLSQKEILSVQEQVTQGTIIPRY